MHQIDPNNVRRDFPILGRKVHGKSLVYLDSAATSQKPRVMIDRMVKLYGEENARPEAGHALSDEATKMFEGVRAQVAKLINAAETREIVFCRGATEALNLVASAFQRAGLKRGDEIVVTGAEHFSNIIPWVLACQETGATLRAAPVTESADLDLDQFEQLLTDRVKIVSATHKSNVTGITFPVKEITRLAHERGIPVVIDGAQAVPHLPVDVRAIGCDIYVGSGHKMGGPSSVGFLYGRAQQLEELPVVEGGSMMAESADFRQVKPKPIPHKFEAGEPAFGEVIPWGAAIDYWTNLGIDRIEAYERELTDYAIRCLADIQGVRVLGDSKDRVSVVSFVVAGKPAGDVSKALDADGIAVRSGKLEAEPLLRKLGVDQAVRASFMFYNTREEADALAASLTRIAASGQR
jgi:cysteine desulfurase / selenocysteine lyase